MTRFTQKEHSYGIITDGDFTIIEAILRYGFSPASELLRLVSRNEM